VDEHRLAVKTRLLLLTAVLLLSACGAKSSATDGPPPAGLSARNEAKFAGIADETYTHGDDCVGDVNNDGHPDVLLNSHTDEWKLFFGSASGRFTRAPNRFSIRDRHGCVLADFNGDGLLDLYFSIGACKGTCRSSKELWLQRRDHTFYPAANKWGIVDQGSRGRAPIAVNANGDKRPDLFTTADIGVKYPSSDKLWINAGKHFVLQHGPPTEDIGAFCAAAADIRHKGLDDIAVCKVDGFVVYRALGGGKYVEDTKSFGLTSFGRRAVRFADVNHDGWIDFISVTRKGVTVLLNEHGRFGKPVFEVGAKNAIDAALGDVDGDGALDLYLQLGPTNTGPDKLFLGDGTGHFGPGPTLPRHGAAEESVTVLPHWRNGRDAFIVNNGYEDTRGVRQLIDVVGERRPSK
jgi:FG-GAP-like repeat